MARIADTQFATRLIAEIASLVSVDTAGGVSFSGSGFFDEHRILLFELIEFAGRMPSEDARAIARDALFAAASPPGLTLDRFLEQLSQFERDYLARRPSRHVLVTQVSIDPRVELPRMVQDGVTISFPAAMPRRFLETRRHVLSHAINSLYVDPPAKYRWVRASVSAKTFIAAGDQALEALEFRLAVLNLGLNRYTGVRWSAGKRKPVNALALAPVHTLHTPSGAPSSETWWYEPNYVVPCDIQSKRIDSALEFSASVMSRLRRLPYADQFKDWVRYYGRALGQPDWAVSFILLWQALESVTGTSHARYDSTVRRAAFLYDDAEHSRRALDSLRNCRNEIVHAQNDPTDLETRLYLLKRHVETALVFHLRHAGDFDSVDESGQFLDLPASGKDLGRRLRMVQKVARFRGL